MSKDDVAAALDEIGTLLALKGENDFKCRAYHSASRTIAQLPDDLATLVSTKKLKDVRGIGEAITPFFLDSKAFLRFRMQGTLAPANHHMITQDRIDSIRRPLYAADAHHSVLATSRNWHANRLERDANQINQPTLIIWGDQDNVIPIKNGYTLHREILNSRFVILKDCGHVPPEEKSDLFTELVTEFAHDQKGRIGTREGDDVRLEL